jgi:predicted  nucleic acid-binding Zn-ribbon protein
MKREFLQGIRVGEQSLSKEVIDAILDEHSRSVGSIRAENGSLKEALRGAREELEAFAGVDVQGLQGQIQELHQQLQDKEAAHRAELEGIVFDRAVEGAITAAKGRNVRAIRAMLDLDGLRKSENQQEDIGKALAALREECGYLFEDAQVPPGYAGGGTAVAQGGDTLAGALRMRFGK